MKTWVRRLHTIPFETLMAWFAVYAGIAGLFHIGASADALDAVISQPLSGILQLLYLFAGVGMLVGLGSGRAAIEVLGLVALIVSVLIRGVAIVSLVGVTKDTSGALVLYLLVAYYGGVRLAHLWKGDVVVLLHPAEDDE